MIWIDPGSLHGCASDLLFRVVLCGIEQLNIMSDILGRLLPCLLHAGPVYSDPYYMTMAGDADKMPDFSNTATLRSVAEGLHKAFGLDPTYPATSINVWKEGESASSSRRRHLLQSSTKVVIIGYAFAQPEAGQKLPEAAELKDAVSAAASKITTSLAEVGVLSEAAVASLSVGLLAPETKPVDVQKLLKEEPANILAKLEELKGKHAMCCMKLSWHDDGSV